MSLILKSIYKYNLTFGGSSFNVMLTKALGVLLGFVLNVFIIRFLDPIESSIFFLGQVGVIAMAVFVRGGLDSVIVRLVGTYQNSINKDGTMSLYCICVKKVIKLSIPTSIALFALSGFLSNWIFESNDAVIALRLLSVSVIPLAISQLHGFFFQGKGQVVLATLIEAPLVSFFTLLLISIVGASNANQVACLYLLSSIASCFVSVVLWNLQNKSAQSDFEIDDKLLATSSNIQFFIILLSHLNHWACLLLLGSLAIHGEITAFTAAYRVSMLSSLALIAINSIMAPRFARAHSLNDRKHIVSLASKAMKISCLFTLPVTFIIFIFATDILALFGQDFYLNANALRTLCMGQFFNVMFGPVVTLLLMTGRENDVLKATIVSTATLLITCFVLIPLFGALGAALACCVSIILLNIFCAMYVYKHLKLVTLLLLFRRV